VKLGLSSYGVGWAVGVTGYPPPPTPLDAFGLVTLAHDLGLRLVQIADNLPLHALTADQRDALRRRADALGVAVEVGTRGLQHDHLMSYLEIAKAFGSSILRVVVDTADYHPDPAEVVERLRVLLPALQAANLVLAIENHDRFRARTLAEIITALDSPCVGICLDTVNSFGALEGPEVVVEVLGPFVVNLHIKEFVVRRVPHNMGFVVTGAPAGQGMLDIPWLLRTLQGYGRSFNAVIETWLDPLPDTAATIALERAYVEQSVAYLRSLIPN
jgi:sugar phosphate isomerase/epimerase